MARPTTMETRFRDQVISDLSELKTSNKNIVEHLTRLNGSVAKHEEAIGKLTMHDVRENQKDRTNDKWMNVAWGVVGAIALAFFEHLPAILGPWMK